jgi:Alpha/beta hydrolase of unknown function (DUF900)
MNNIISVGLNGTFTKTGNSYTTINDIDVLFDELYQREQKKLVIYFHGGLVNEKAGIENAKYISDFLQSEACTISFVWKTGFIEVFNQQFEDLQKSSVFKEFFKKIISLTSIYIGGGRKSQRGLGKNVTLSEIESQLALKEPFAKFDDVARREANKLTEIEIDLLQRDVLKRLERDVEFLTLISDFQLDSFSSPEKFEKINDQENKINRGPIEVITLVAVSKIIWNTVNRLRHKRDHGFYLTLLEETYRSIHLNAIGHWTWGEMKNKAKKLWSQNPEENINTVSIGTYFLEKLSSLKKKNPDFTIDLIGHSAGSIVICHLLDAIHERFLDLKIRNVLFMAPACTSELFHEHIVSKSQLYENFRMFTMSDELEKKDILIPHLSSLFTRSLLYFISGVLEDESDKPIAGLELHIGKIGRQSSTINEFSKYHKYDSTLRDINNFLSAEDRLVLSQTITASDGLNSNATHHGDFDRDEFTLKSIKSIISK